MLRNRTEEIYDIRLYPESAPLETFRQLSDEMEKFKEQFEHFNFRMLPDIYNKIYDLQQRFNNIALAVKVINSKLDTPQPPIQS